ncbi:sensor histidine kinase [Ferruginibacter albus]|uniref:sensor histidine kinase n=1 Tax=Ferruginibacter albus TaxID=2875540 RepID=UPI001CC5AA60|nr:histidine kinase [Ferruginibacter albus]UAY52514.1 histidine kinase [Ferruginibacter albus]
MSRENFKYWICQIVGWGAYAGISIFFYLTLSTRKIDNFFLLVAIDILIGLGVSHLMRMVIKEYKFLQNYIQKQIVLFGITIIVFSVVYACADVGIEKLLGVKDTMGENISVWNEIARNSINNFFILFIWNLIYYTYHYIEFNRLQELNTLKLKASVKELELKTIKSHINPHFIFNALNSIRALVDENPVRARTAITELSNILRSSMQTEKLETVPLERELNIVKDYLALEQMRFEERLKVELKIDEDTLEQPVPPMMLQTLVENAIKHGISKKMNGGVIRIISSFKNDHHELIVQNTGQLSGHFNEDGFGIRSTQDRLNLLYHGNAVFSLTNLNDEMVQTKIVIPV